MLHCLVLSRQQFTLLQLCAQPAEYLSRTAQASHRLSEQHAAVQFATCADRFKRTGNATVATMQVVERCRSTER